MNAFTKMSSKGQVFAVKSEGLRIVLDATPPKRRAISHQEFVQMMPKYDGPRVSVDDMKRGIDDAFPELENLTT
jgi:hypothetical protein